MKNVLLFSIFLLLALNVFGQEVPDGITYITKDNSINTQALEKLTNLIIDQTNDEIPKSIGCGPFFWKELLNASFFSQEIGIPMEIYVLNGDTLQKLEGRVIRWEDQTIKLLSILRRIVSSSDEYHFRKLSAQEMQLYWMMISYDIEEPIFMLEGPGINLLIDCTDEGEIFFIDNYYQLLHRSQN